MSDRPQPEDLRRLINGFQVSQAIYVAATLGVADLLAHGPRSSAELAEKTQTDAPSLYRLLRALAGVGVFREEEDRRFALAPLGEFLRSDIEGSVLGWAEWIGRDPVWNTWRELRHSVRTGENAFGYIHATDAWTYREQHPEDSAAFDRAMTAMTRQSQAALLEAYDFSRFGSVVDVAGGQGALLAALLRQHPSMHGVLFDQPHVVEQARELLREVGVLDRCRVVAGSFFEPLPDGADAYILKFIVHDWDDPEATQILRQCRAALPPHGTVLVIERELGPPNEPTPGKFADLNMLVMLGGRERTEAEYAALFESAGLRLTGSTQAASGLTVFEAAAAS